MPFCPNVGDGPGRCPEHRRGASSGSPGYGAKRSRLRDRYFCEHPTCETILPGGQRCRAPAVDVHHRNHARPGDPTFYTKAGPAQARGMLVEAAFSASRAPGPLRAFYRRVKDRRGFQIATVATARKMTVLCWHLINRGEDYAFARPSLNAHKRRKLELAAGATSKRGPVRGASHDYHVKQLRDQERALVEHAERSYEVLVAHWQPQRPAALP